MDDELNTMLQKALASKLGDGWIRALFPTTVIYITYEIAGEYEYEDGKMYEVPWRYDEELGLLVGEETEVELAYVEKRIAAEFGPELSAPIVMKNEEKRIVYGPVLVPGEPDHDGESVTSEKIEEVAHEFMKSFGNIDVQHTLKSVAVPVESYLMPIDVELPGLNGLVAVPKGSWMMGTYVEDDNTWQEIKDGKRTGFSIMGVDKSQAGIFAGKSVPDAAFKRVYLRDLKDWTVPFVGIVDQPCVPKAEFLTIKSRGFVSRLFTKKSNPEEGDMKVEEFKQAMKEVLGEREPEAAEKAKDDKIAELEAEVTALKAKVDEVVKSEPEADPTPPEAAEKDKDEEPEVTLESLKSQMDELAAENVELKSFKAQAEKKLAIKPESNGLPEEGAATKSKPDFGNRDAAGRKVRS